MINRQDFIDCELVENPALKGKDLSQAVKVLELVPFMEPQRVTELSTLLFMAVGFMSNMSAEKRLLAAGESNVLQGQISSYIIQLKENEGMPPYPFKIEQALLQSIARANKKEAQHLLNELLGAIFFNGGGDLGKIKSRVAELLVLISRTAVERGIDPQKTLNLSHQYLQTIPHMQSVDELCYWLSGVINSYMEGIFDFSSAHHASIIHRCIQYIGSHYAEKLTLASVAQMVYLSPTYLSRRFKQETGVGFSEYVNSVRVGKAKVLLHHLELRLVDIALAVGYEDQSHFTKVFRRMTGTTPSKYRCG